LFKIKGDRQSINACPLVFIFKSCLSHILVFLIVY